MYLFNCLITLLFSSVSMINWEEEVKTVITQEDLNIIFYIESNNNLNAVGDGLKAIGVLQIHKICVDEVNQHYKLNYEHSDMYGRIDAVKIFYKYLAIGAEHFHKKYDKMPSKTDYLRMWNGGIYNGYQKESTLDYCQKFLMESNRRKNKASKNK